MSMSLELIIAIAELCRATGISTFGIQGSYNINNNLQLQCQAEYLKCVEDKKDPKLKVKGTTVISGIEREEAVALKACILEKVKQ